MNKIKEQILPHLIAVIIFIAISFIYLSPVIQGKVIRQHDGIQATGMAKEVSDLKEKTGEVSMWTNSAFGGMPTYQIKGDASKNIFWYLNQATHLGLPYSTVAILFIYLIGFYLLLSVLELRHWLCIAGAIAFALASYNIIIIAAGHITKAYAIGLMPPVIAGVYLAYKQKLIKGAILTTIGLGLQITVNHVQITYYLFLMILLYGIFQFVEAIKEKKISDFLKASGVLIIAALLAIGPNVTQLWTTYEYGKESIRGKSELTIKDGDKEHSGLDKGYALAWSYGKFETLSLLVPNVVGGKSDYMGNNPKALENVDNRYKNDIAQQSQYWGDQPSTSGPVYFGAIICLLFILGLFIIENKIKWWLLAATILSIVLSWGRNFMPITDLFFYYFPLYNKFRTVSMSLVIAGLSVPTMAMLSIKELLENKKTKKKLKEFYISLSITAGIVLLLIIYPGKMLSSQEEAGFNRYEEQIQKEKISPKEKQAYLLNVVNVKNNLKDARRTISRNDAYRTLAFILIAAVLIWFFYQKKMSDNIFIVSLSLLILFDLWTVDKRYLNNDMFKSKAVNKQALSPSNIDQFIKKDKDPNFRVLNITLSTFNDATTSYFHKSIGGYHGAKIRRYQDLIDHYIGRELSLMRSALTSKEPKFSVADIVKQSNVLNMLNTKYIIVDPARLIPTINPLINMNALGNAWFVTEYKIVENADKEIEELAIIDPKTTAIINKKFTENKDIELPKIDFIDTDTTTIMLTSYKPNHLIYRTKNPKNQLAVFSEIYYEKGWKAYIDGKLTPHIRADYILRAMVIPAGEHKIEFKFEPTSYIAGQTISLISSIIVLLSVIVGIFVLNKKKQKGEKNK